jgi:type IV secretion system protein VirB1
MWADVAAQCAPHVHPATIERIIQVESGGNALSVNVNRLAAQPPRATTTDDAKAIARAYIANGYSVDLGAMQVNSGNLPSLGLTLDTIFDPCVNVRAGATILSADYAAAAARLGEGQAALAAALSAYNTGDFARGFANGYVGRYYGTMPSLAGLHAGAPVLAFRNPYTADTEVSWTTP